MRKPVFVEDAEVRRHDAALAERQAVFVGSPASELETVVGGVPRGAPVERSAAVRLPGRLLARIDEYWHLNRLKSRSEAIRVLVELGLGR